MCSFTSSYYCEEVGAKRELLSPGDDVNFPKEWLISIIAEHGDSNF